LPHFPERTYYERRKRASFQFFFANFGRGYFHFYSSPGQKLGLMDDDACCMMMHDSVSLQGVSNEQDYDAQHDVAKHPQDAV
jgi:hypothetical protein